MLKQFDMVGVLRDLRLRPLARNASGAPVCACGAVLTEAEPFCGDCAELARVRESRRARREQSSQWLAELPRNRFNGFASEAWLSAVGPRVVAAARAWQPLTAGLVLCGPSGGGKTSSLVSRLLEFLRDDEAAVAASNEPPQPLPSFCWTTEAELIADRRGWPLGRGDAPRVEKAMGAAVLVIDELGYSRAPELMFEVVSERVRHGRGPTSVTTGLGHSELTERYGTGFVRRLTDGGALVDLHARSQ